MNSFVDHMLGYNPEELHHDYVKKVTWYLRMNISQTLSSQCVQSWHNNDVTQKNSHRENGL